jgi:shikimate dehydrogenase
MYYSALIGNSTTHSVSPLMYEEFAKTVLDGREYKHLKIDVSVDELANALLAFKTLKFIGVNVTLPHKMAVMNFIDEIDPIAIAVGAVNTITFTSKTIGHNTDWKGVYIPIQKYIAHKSYNLNKATILGSGGAARAAIYACRELNIKQINVVYREDANDKQLADLKHNAKRHNIELFTYDQVGRLINDAQLVINGTSAGMVGNELTPFELTELENIDLTGKIFLDAVFNPINTPLLKYFKERNAYTIDGLWMMIYQGVCALSLWLGYSIDISEERLIEIHKLLEKELLHV